jgi:ABC-type transport system involved in multi-copper enzyme maturation permease subunit
MFRLFWLNLRQLLRQRHLWYINFFVIVVSEIAPAFAELFTFGKVEVAIIECASACVYTGVLLFVITSCFHLLGKELNERVALTMFSKPISMRMFILIKFCSLLSAVTVIFLFQALFVCKQFYVFGLSQQGLLMALYWLFCVYLQGVIILAISVGLTILSSPILGLVLTFVIMILPYFWTFTSLVWVCWIIPALPWFDLSNALYKGNQVPFHYIASLFAYSVLYTLVWLILSTKWIKAKEF